MEGCAVLNPEKLKEHGFDDATIERTNGLIASAFDLSMVFNRFTFGDQYLIEKLGIPAGVIERPDFDLLSAMGMTKKEIAEANAYACGTMTIEGAPHLKTQHLAVFDCANKCGKTGERLFVIRPTSSDTCSAIHHGAISKTINMTNEAPPVDADAHIELEAWSQRML